jgi:predicted component of type VI protein secretion system
MDTVRLELTVEHMRESVLHALVMRQDEIQKAVEREISRLVDSGALEHKIAQAVERQVDQAIDQGVKSAMTRWVRESPTIKQAIEDAVTKALWGGV